MNYSAECHSRLGSTPGLYSVGLRIKMLKENQLSWGSSWYSSVPSGKNWDTASI